MRAARDFLGPDGRIRVDANGGWNVDEAEHAIHALAEFDLEYVEQPCATSRSSSRCASRVTYMGIPIAADESVRKAADPLAVARAGAADMLVIKAQPLGGIAAALRLVADAGLPGRRLQRPRHQRSASRWAPTSPRRCPQLEYDCGLGTAALLAADVTDAPLLPVGGAIAVRRVDVSERLLRSTRRARSAPPGGWTASVASTPCWIPWVEHVAQRPYRNQTSGFDTALAGLLNSTERVALRSYRPE